MPRLTKFREQEPSLQPWQHYEQSQNALGLAENVMQSGFNPESPIQQFQYSKKPNEIGFEHCLLHSPQKNMYSSQFPQRAKYVKRSQRIDYVKKNQENIRSYHCMSQNYNTLLNDDLDNFMPLNPNCGFTPHLKRPTINTTYIGYYDEQPFLITSCVRSHVKKEPKRSKSIDNSRPRTSDPMTVGHDVENKTFHDNDSNCHFYDRATLSVGGYHLQKMLKIKQKLRQKLKRNSQKKDIERGMYVRSTMKIQQDRNSQSIEQNNSYIHSHTPIPSRKSSSNSIQNNNKDKIKIDKWKQYMKAKNQAQSKKSPSKNAKIGKCFAVFGGSIYK